MRNTQGTFSFLPDLDDGAIATQVQYALDRGWAVNFEYTDDPHPHHTYWELAGAPLFDITDASAVMRELADVRRAHPDTYVRISAYDASYGRQTVGLSFIVQRPAHEPRFRVERQLGAGGVQHVTLRTVFSEAPGERGG